jgi:hypothetical protein
MCSVDRRCKPGCAVPDPDCDCLEDGVCQVGCVAPRSDPDCAASCAVDGICSNQACALPDEDCQLVGAMCGRSEHCNSRLCVTSAQQSSPYCSKKCTEASECASGMQCTSGECRHRVLPVANVGDVCIPGETYCGGDDFVCAAYGAETQPHCRQRCYESPDCESGFSCTSRGDVPLGICLKNTTLPRLSNETLGAPQCSMAPVEFGFALLALVGLRVRRERERKGALGRGDAASSVWKVAARGRQVSGVSE